MSDTSPNLQYIQEKLAHRVLATNVFRGDEVVSLAQEGLRESFRFLKEDDKLDFVFLSDITAVDYWKKKEPRFEVVYQLLSLKGRRRLCVKVPVPENDPVIESLTPIWVGANWLEREVWDLFGIRFAGHPNLKRVLLYEEFQGHPLRKDYPVNLCQPRVPERQVAGTFVDERSRNKLLRLQNTLGKKN
jgi:NADH-quinone oxidoreductase subunit C